MRSECRGYAFICLSPSRALLPFFPATRPIPTSLRRVDLLWCAVKYFLLSPPGLVALATMSALIFASCRPAQVGHCWLPCL